MYRRCCDNDTCGTFTQRPQARKLIVNRGAWPRPGTSQLAAARHPRRWSDIRSWWAMKVFAGCLFLLAAAGMFVTAVVYAIVAIASGPTLEQSTGNIGKDYSATGHDLLIAGAFLGGAAFLLLLGLLINNAVKATEG
jgi:hypothetical protein